jgi:hypothetical protein
MAEVKSREDLQFPLTIGIRGSFRRKSLEIKKGEDVDRN